MRNSSVISRQKLVRPLSFSLCAALLLISVACEGGPDVLRPVPEPTIEPEEDAGVIVIEPEVESPCRPIRCGDGFVDAPENCDPGDPETTQGCNENCQTETPQGWSCFTRFYGDGFCDCGCGFADIDCTSMDAATCEFDHCPPQHVPRAEQNAYCALIVIEGEICETPIAISGISSSVTGVLNANDDYDGVLFDECTFDPSTGVGGDVVYRLNVPDNTYLEVKLVSSEFGPTVFVLSACGTAPDLCVGAGENFLQREVAELMIFSFDGGQDYFIVVDSFFGQGAYTLSWRRLEDPFCGNGVRDPYEDCDDGNQNINDGCSDFCFLEEGFACPLDGGSCVPAGCGNSVLEPSELCDDGNVQNGDGCNASCLLEPPADWTCPVFYFGSDDGCDCGCGAFDTDCPGLGRDVCQFENCNTGVAQDQEVNYTCRATECGDGIVEGAEECDDANEDEGDGCFDCRREAPADWTCPARWFGAGDGCHCGCGVVDNDCPSSSAPCDVNGCLAGGPDPADNAVCLLGECGDRVIDIGEACDDGNTVSGDGCNQTCQFIEDGFVCEAVAVTP